MVKPAAKTTIVLPTGQPERANDVRRLLEHLRQTGLIGHGGHCNLILADGNKTTVVAEIYEHTCAQLPGCSYISAPHLDVHDRIRMAVNASRTTYTLVLGDDDILFPEGLKEAEGALDAQQSAAVAHGQYLAFMYGSNGELMQAHMYVDTPEHRFAYMYTHTAVRVSAYIANYAAPVFYGLVRTEVLQKALHTLHNFAGVCGGFKFLGLIDPICHEFAHAAGIISQGGIIRTNNLYAARKIEPMQKQHSVHDLLGVHKEEYGQRLTLLINHINDLCGGKWHKTLRFGLNHYLQNCLKAERGERTLFLTIPHIFSEIQKFSTQNTTSS